MDLRIHDHVISGDDDVMTEFLHDVIRLRGGHAIVTSAPQYSNAVLSSSRESSVSSTTRTCMPRSSRKACSVPIQASCRERSEDLDHGGVACHPLNRAIDHLADTELLNPGEVASGELASQSPSQAFGGSSRG